MSFLAAPFFLILDPLSEVNRSFLLHLFVAPFCPPHLESFPSPFLFLTFQPCLSALSSSELLLHLGFRSFIRFSVFLLHSRVVGRPQGFFGRPLRGRFSTVLLRRYLTMMLCTVDFGILSSSPMAPSDLPSFQRSTTRCRCTTSCSLVFWKTPAAIGPPVAPGSAASVGADKQQTVVEARRVKRRGVQHDNVTLYWFLFFSLVSLLCRGGGGQRSEIELSGAGGGRCSSLHHFILHAPKR